MTGTAENSTHDEDGFFAAYSRFAATLRTWLVAYGVGGPALILTQEKLADRFMSSPSSRTIIVLFLVGVGAQVLAALLFKTAMWYLYRGEGNEALRKTRRYRASDWLSEAYVVDTALDIASIVLFGIATYKLLSLVA